jgi:hypothetical protein
LQHKDALLRLSRPKLKQITLRESRLSPNNYAGTTEKNSRITGL